MSRAASHQTSVSDLTPTEGARFLLERQSEADRHATYRATIYAPDATYVGEMILDEDSSVTVAIEAPAELVAMLSMFGKLTARSAAGQRAKGIPPWPARVLRWRGPGRGA